MSSYGPLLKVTAIKWKLPNRFQISPRPTAIDKACIGRFVYRNWQSSGWQLGKVTDLITKDTPRLFKKYNVRVAWADATKGPTMLDLSRRTSTVPMRRPTRGSSSRRRRRNDWWGDMS